MTHTLSNYAKDTINFFLRRIPNFQESLENSKTQTIIDTVFGRFINQFNDNPTVPGVIRDYLKIQTSFTLKNTQIGSTETTHGEGGIYAATSKPICKSLLLITYYLTTEEIDNLRIEGLKTTARAANILCEIPSRGLQIIERDKQLFEKDHHNINNQTFWQFFTQSQQLPWIFEATFSGPSKALTADLIGEYIINYKLFSIAQNDISYVRFFKITITSIENMISFSLGGDISSALLPEDHIYSKIYKSASQHNFNFLSPSLYLTSLTAIAIDLTTIYITNFINTCIFQFGSKIVQDTVGVGIRSGYDYLQESYNNITEFSGNITDLEF